MNIKIPFKQRGFTLTEALISVAVLSVGMLSVAKLQGDLMASSGLAKARAEAVQLAEGELEKLRNAAIKNQFDAIDDLGGADSITVTGRNAIFTLEHQVDDATAPVRKNIAVTVTWGDPKEGNQEVRVDGIVAWNDPAMGLLAGGDFTGMSANLLRPTGRARVGGETLTSEEIADVKSNGPQTVQDPNDPSATVSFDTYIGEVDGKNVLIDSTGKVLLTIDDGTGFSTITGAVYGYDPVFTSTTAANTFVMTSDASYCAVEKTGSDKNLRSISYGTEDFNYFVYQCYFGGEWYGNVGVVRTGNFNTNDRICVGKPGATDTGYFNSQHPVQSTVRSYRGFSADNSYSTGIGMIYNQNTEKYDYTPTHYGYYVNNTNDMNNDGIQDNIGTIHNNPYHNFLLSTISGQETCETKLQEVDNLAYLANSSAPLPFGDQGIEGNPGNPGRGFCFTGSGINCAESTTSGDDSTTAPTTTIEGSITLTGGANITGLTLGEIDGAGGVACTLATNKQDYSCTIDWAGWAGDSWTTTLTVKATGGSALCATGTSGPGTYAAGGDIVLFSNMPAGTELVTQNIGLCK